MKKTILLFILIAVSTAIQAQQLTLYKSFSPEKLQAAIESQTGYGFFYETGTYDQMQKVKFDADNIPLKDVLDQWTKAQPIQYQVVGTVIVLKSMVDPAHPRKRHHPQTDAFTHGLITRKILDQHAGSSLSQCLIDLGVAQTATDATGKSGVVLSGVRTTDKGSSWPLVVLDGFNYDGNIDRIKVSDVDHVEIINDASASAYGLGGSNGVIKITTLGAAQTHPQDNNNDYGNTIKVAAGYTRYKDAGIDDILYQFCKNAGLTLVYQGKTPDQIYEGSIPLSTNSTTMISLLNAAGVNCTINGSELIVH